MAMKLYRAKDVQKLVEALKMYVGMNLFLPCEDGTIRGKPIAHEALSAFQAIKPIEISDEFDESEAESMWSKLRIMRKVWTWMEGTRWQHEQIVKKLRGEG